MRKFLFLAIFFLIAVIFSGCGESLMYLKFPSGWTCYKSGTITEIINVREDEPKFLGPIREPERRRIGDIVIKTESGEVYTISSDKLFDTNDQKEPSETYTMIKQFSPGSVGRKVTIYILDDKVIGISPLPQVIYYKK